MHRVVISEQAHDQLDALYATVEQISGCTRAKSFTGAIVDFCMGLSLFPKREIC